METGEGFVHEWRIENLSHWCAEVHGHCIQSPKFHYPCSHLELYPKGIGGQGEHLVVRLGDLKHSFSAELSFHSSDGSLLCSKQQVDGYENRDLKLPPGPKFEDVLSRIRESEDFIALKLRTHDENNWVQRMCTTVNVFKISVKMNPRWVETIKSGKTKEVCNIQFSPNNYFDRIELSTCLENDKVHFLIDPSYRYEYPFAVEMCMILTGSDDTVDSCLKNEHVFWETCPWRFPDTLQKKELVGTEILILLWVREKNLIQRTSYGNYDYNNFCVELNNTLCFSEKAPSTADKIEVLTKDSGSQTSDTTFLHDFSDITLNCDNVTFPVHKSILCNRSPVFKTMLSTDMAEAASSKVDIGDLDPSTLSRFLTYLYTGAVEEELQCDRALKLYYAADKYQVPSLKRDCSKFLCANVSISNVCDILSLGDRHQDDELTAASHVFILDNFTTVLKSNEWGSFMSREPSLAVKTVTHFAAKESVVRKHDSK